MGERPTTPDQMPDWWHELARAEMKLLAANPTGERWPELAAGLSQHREAQGGDRG